MAVIKVYSDGSCDNRSELRIMTIGVVLDDPENKWQFHSYVGSGGNSYISEWLALWNAFDLAAEHNRQTGGIHSYIFFADAQTVVKQVAGEWRIRNPKIEWVWREMRKVKSTFKFVGVRWIPRLQNTEADALAEIALNEYLENIPK